MRRAPAVLISSSVLGLVLAGCFQKAPSSGEASPDDHLLEDPVDAELEATEEELAYDQDGEGDDLEAQVERTDAISYGEYSGRDEVPPEEVRQAEREKRHEAMEFSKELMARGTLQGGASGPVPTDPVTLGVDPTVPQELLVFEDAEPAPEPAPVVESIASSAYVVAESKGSSRSYVRKKNKDKSSIDFSSVAPEAPPPPPTSQPVADVPIGGEDLATAQRQIESNTESYEHPGINDMTLSRRDALSTFSIDVDTASYTIARRKLLDGYLPPTASVRVEEFVNYFPYSYVQPTGDAPFAVNMEAAPNPFEPRHHVLRIGVQGDELSADERKPVRLTFLVDVSGSMSSADKLGLAKRSLHLLVDQLDAEDSVALGTYAGATRMILGPTPATDKDTLHAAIESLSSGGGTAMSSGIDMAYDMAQRAFVPGAENRVVVLSDGDANIGPSSHQQILSQIQHYAKEGITLTTVGFGMGNYKDTMMEQLANDGDGNYFYIDGMNEARKVFSEDLSGTIQTIARDVKIQVEFDPETVYAYRLIGYENRDIADRDFRNDAVDAGEVGSGHKVTALYDVVLNDGYDGGPLATVRLRNKPPGPDAPAEEWLTEFPEELLHHEFEDASKSFRLAFSAAMFAELLRESPYAAELSYREVRELAADAADGKEAYELVELIETAGKLAGERGSFVQR